MAKPPPLSAHCGAFTSAWSILNKRRIFLPASGACHASPAYLRGTGAAPYIVAQHKRPQTAILRGDLNAPDRGAIDAIHARLTAAGAKNLTSPGDLKEPGGGYGFVVREPSSLLLLIVAGDERHAETADAVDLPRKLSHLVFSNPDKTAIERFFIDGLGFRLIDRSRRINFLNCNTGHHSVATSMRRRQADLGPGVLDRAVSIQEYSTLCPPLGRCIWTEAMFLGNRCLGNAGAYHLQLWRLRRVVHRAHGFPLGI
jgi:hypothetical protein